MTPKQKIYVGGFVLVALYGMFLSLFYPFAGGIFTGVGFTMAFILYAYYKSQFVDDNKSAINASYKQQQANVKSLLSSLKQEPMGTQAFLNKLEELKKAYTHLQKIEDQMQQANTVNITRYQ